MKNRFVLLMAVAFFLDMRIEFAAGENLLAARLAEGFWRLGAIPYSIGDASYILLEAVLGNFNQDETFQDSIKPEIDLESVDSIKNFRLPRNSLFSIKFRMSKETKTISPLALFSPFITSVGGVACSSYALDLMFKRINPVKQSVGTLLLLLGAATICKACSQFFPYETEINKSKEKNLLNQTFVSNKHYSLMYLICSESNRMQFDIKKINNVARAREFSLVMTGLIAALIGLNKF